MSNYKICTELALLKKNYDQPITLVEGLFFRQRDTIRMIEYYVSSRYLNGQKDELGREKPFYNIVNGMCDVENAAKDIDTKDIQATSDDGNHYVESFLMSKDIYEWMKKVNFAKTLNDMRDMHTRYGSLLVKKVMVDDDGEKRVAIEMPEWKNVITDQVNILKGGIAEVHFMTPMELVEKTEWDQEEVRKIIKKLAKGGSGRRVPIYEVRGEFPVACFSELEDGIYSEDDEYTYSYQLHILAGDPTNYEGAISSNVSLSASKFIPLYWENDTERVYKYLPRKRKAGRDFGLGVIEEGEEAQVWTNDAVLKQYRAMEYTSKVVAQTASKKLKGRNILTEVDDGQVLEHEDKKPIEPISLLPSGGLSQYGMLIQQWFAQLERATSAYAMQRGEVTTKNFRLQSLALNQSSGVFKDLQEELGIFITDIFEDWIMPYLGEQLNAEHVLAHEFSMEELREIDKNFSTHHANDRVKELILSGQAVTVEQYEEFQNTASEVIGQTKSQRFLEVPKDYYKKAALKITVNITGEQQNKAIVLESLTNILTIYSKNPQIAQDPVLTQIFMKIVELSGAGISPVSLVAAIHEQARVQKVAEAKAQAAQAAGGGQPQPDGTPGQVPGSTPQPGPVDGLGTQPAPQVKNLSLTASGGQGKGR